MALCTFEGVVGRREGNDIGLLLCSGVERCIHPSIAHCFVFLFFAPQEARYSLASE